MASIFSASKKRRKILVYTQSVNEILRHSLKAFFRRIFSVGINKTTLRIDYHTLDFSASTLIDVISRPDLEMSKVRWNEEMRRIRLLMICLRSQKYITVAAATPLFKGVKSADPVSSLHFIQCRSDVLKIATSNKSSLERFILINITKYFNESIQTSSHLWSSSHQEPVDSSSSSTSLPSNSPYVNQNELIIILLQ